MHVRVLRPWSTAYFVLAATTSLVSPQFSRRSLWPRITHLMPMSVSILAGVSPVQAPGSLSHMFCAATAYSLRREPATSDRKTKGGAQRTSTSLPASTSSLPALRSATSCFTLSGVPLAFQLPPMMNFRACRAVRARRLASAPGRPTKPASVPGAGSAPLRSHRRPSAASARHCCGRARRPGWTSGARCSAGWRRRPSCARARTLRGRRARSSSLAWRGSARPRRRWSASSCGSEAARRTGAAGTTTPWRHSKLTSRRPSRSRARCASRCS
mmetsp:Transcript_1551/g.4728  ORF Transcript_1551/g.4728 Transcript_1551/m.4728 type:complete len:271 (-) Transcript_1551:261-1073(-)